MKCFTQKLVGCPMTMVKFKIIQRNTKDLIFHGGLDIYYNDSLDPHSIYVFKCNFNC